MKCKILGPIHKFYFCEVDLNYALLDFYDTNQRKYVYLKNFFVPWRKHLSYDKKKNKFSFYRRKDAPNRTRFKEARLVAYASLQKFSEYTYYLR